MMASSTKTIDRSSAAERMRLHRERRRTGVRCLMIELRESEVAELVRRGLLKQDTRNDRNAKRFMHISIGH